MISLLQYVDLIAYCLIFTYANWRLGVLFFLMFCTAVHYNLTGNDYHTWFMGVAGLYLMFCKGTGYKVISLLYFARVVFVDSILNTPFLLIQILLALDTKDDGGSRKLNNLFGPGLSKKIE